MAFLGITKAAKTYKDSLNNKFSTYAYQCIKNEILQYIRDNKKHSNTLSIYSNINDDCELQDVIPDKINVIEETENEIGIEYLNEYIDILPGRLSKVIRYHLSGHTMKQIGEILGVSQPQISRDYRKAINILRYRFKDWR